MKQIKDKVAVQKGYPDWETMENHFIDINEAQPVNIAVLMNSAWEDVADLIAQEFCNYITRWYEKSGSDAWLLRRAKFLPYVESQSTEEIFQKFKSELS